VKNVRSLLRLIVVLALLATPATSLGAARPSTPEELATAVRLTAELERDPLGPNAGEYRRWLFAWLAEAPDVIVLTCPYHFDLFESNLGNFGTELMLQSLFGAASFAIQNPSRAEDEPAKQVAGIESMLRAYENYIRTMPGGRRGPMDELIDLRDTGGLEAWVTLKWNECLEAMSKAR